ncbi:bifunctional DNA primase/polymerase [Natronococcus jeotgali]|uniref:DNA primase small subunit n=1 Tax=Natronococcus jeotgali DSM 18795 TaxID=1227498 RepID=L9XLG5_9EURY|nr:DNA primase small subunit [Natronococcus jeotgali]ELY62624.1 DNA primase small subunit [Natronococcus jeotgali DSM 18795]
MTWREATRDEIFAYYDQEFPEYTDQLPGFITATGPKEFGLSFRDRHPICKDDRPDRDFIRRATWRTDSTGERIAQHFDGFEDVRSFIQAPAHNDPYRDSEYALADPDLLVKSDPVSEGVYYGLDNWERPWVIAVDIDAKDIAIARADRELEEAEIDAHHDDRSHTEILLTESGIQVADPAGYPYAFEDLERTIEYGFETRDIFETEFDADETMVVYSGQGVHVYLLNDDSEHDYDEQSREVLNDFLIDRYGIPIDPVVTADRSRLLRVPYSLHAEVCRVVQPIDSPAFDPQTDARPQFLE